jgi:hypothetical protein
MSKHHPAVPSAATLKTYERELAAVQTWWDSLTEIEKQCAYDRGHVATGDLLSLVPPTT